MIFGAYAAAAWGSFFSFVHLYWLLGGRLGLPAGLSLTDHAPLLVIDILAIPGCLAAAALALALAHARPAAGPGCLPGGRPALRVDRATRCPKSSDTASASRSVAGLPGALIERRGARSRVTPITRVGRWPGCQAR